ncbi:alpha-L-arabinofuranosidase C-terminal domain-containing protein [Demequina pelophila]|uniref:alpha-L-arabinofuranosidase C-terminal domain-containing protein n=1 Tax=Demequina pelophila TaxID=1638984 RepID=UPI000783854F|nr:alpha-L-arabinofuranosidase C-terminal domain-containing protein [Demequina pelophila]
MSRSAARLRWRRRARRARSIVDLVADPSRSPGPVSPLLIGAFLEDINHAIDGALGANAVANHSFEGDYVRRTLHTNTIAALTHRRPRRRRDGTRHWDIRGGTLAISTDRPLVPHGHHARVTSGGRAVLRNEGHGIGGPAIGARVGVAFTLTLAVRVDGAPVRLAARLADRRGRVLAASPLQVEGRRDDGWALASCTLTPDRTALVRLEIGIDGEGVVDLDEVALIPGDHWGAGDPRWSQGVLRRDVVEALRDMRPRFLRFPGGCIVEGLDATNAYRWKDTVGPLAGRRPEYNLWAVATRGGDYSQSFQVGYYEYFLLCEDIGAAPLPVVDVGIACQLRSGDVCAPARFEELVQDALDLIDWATGDPATSQWARLRAEAGHPEPFPLEMIGIGNEAGGPDYLDRFARMRAAIARHHPGITAVMSAGALTWGTEFAQAWEAARAAPDPGGLVVDEHFYKSPSWTAAAARRYDDYPRDVRVAVLEYAANLPSALTPKPFRAAPNTMRSALAEAAFLTGCIRNSDVVAMTAFAPLLNVVGRGQWEHNLIDVNALRVMPTANYHVQRLLARTLGERRVPLEGGAGGAGGAAGRGGAVRSPALPPGVEGVATATDRAVTVVLVNPTARRVPVRLRVPGAEAGASADVTRIAAPEGARNLLPVSGRGTHAVRPRSSHRVVAGESVRVALPGHSLVTITVPLAAAGGGTPGR